MALTHGHASWRTQGRKSFTYTAWQNMLARCKRHPRYAGRGVQVCRRWQSFENFLADMGERPKGTTLDRKDGTKGYDKSNCRWATASTQAANRTGWNKLPDEVGVGFDNKHGKWRARVRRNGVVYFLGYFACKEAAIAARKGFLDVLNAY
jgi:hypothetical protein